uniref:FAS-associated factor 2 n=1 Tax=Junco hyemalis TaxID=40217 RepID=A0A8C5IK00_JUNHY
MAAPEERELTAEQTEKLLQFQDLTGIESMDQCRHTLEQHNWNIEAAVQDRLNEQEGVPSVFNPPPLRPLQVNTADHRIYSYVVSRPQPRGLLGWGYYFIMLPFRFTYYTLLDIFRFALRFIRPDPRSRVTDPVGDIISFIHMFEEKYGRIHPVFYQGTYSQALNDAKRELRFLLVYLHGDDHQDTDEFCRNTLCAPEVITLINTRMLFWACSTNKPEGYRVSQALRENTYPFLAVIMLKDRRMTVVGRLEGLIQADDLINQLMFIMDANQTYLVSERLEREERNQTQVLRQQQDEAYLASLRADQEKERKKKEERERKKKKEEEVQQQKLAEERRRQVRAEGLQCPWDAWPAGGIALSCLGLEHSRGSWGSCAAGDRHKGPSLPCRHCRRRRRGGRNAFLQSHTPMTQRASRSFSSCPTIPEWSGDSTSHSH